MKLAERLLRATNRTALLGVDIFIFGMCTVAHFLEEKIESLEEVGEHFENKLEQLDRN